MIEKGKGESEKGKVLRFSFTFTFFLLAFASSCTTSPQPPSPSVPEWDVIPLGVVDTFCMRLKSEGLAEGAPVAVVSTTQPIASMNALAALAGPEPRRANAQEAATALRASQRSIPLTLSGGGCSWIAVDSARAYQRADQMIVELSAPLANPFERGQAGIFVRVSLGGEHGQWYWISLLPRAGGWVVGYIKAISS